ncbi:S41 family peptidase [Tenacibaculum agarivorans]|uniref:S41 family peptidase n=1 Tax=Tenacibaculum agarivorans TaxID=1908389 RepID=UPI00094B8A3B|nr:S41 family peptidase [Tenacibaculum agarivorans]
MKYLIISLSLCLFFNSNTVKSQSKNDFEYAENFPADSLKIWTNELMKELSKSHPGFYRYTPKKKFDSIIHATVNSFTDSLNTIEYYRKIKPLIAQIGCLHTSLNLSEEYENIFNKKPNLIPIEVFIDEGNQVFITKNYSGNNNLKRKSKLLSINGKPITIILDILMKSIPSDGYNTTLKTLLLNKRFAFWYRSMIDASENFEIETKFNDTKKTLKLKGVTSSKFESIASLQSITNSKQLAFNITNNTGVLTIKTFAKTEIRNNGQKFKKYIKSVFKTLNEKNIENLIIDLRYNSGGTDGNAVFLASHFFDTPFRYWEKIEVTKNIAEQINGSNRLFYKKPVKVGSTYHWIGARSWITKEFDYYKIQNPAKDNYKGKTYIITNGLCMSSCSDFAAIISDNKKAIIIGQETGGGFQGNSSGMMPTTEINGNMKFTIPLQKYTNAVDVNKNYGRGTIPDFTIVPTLNDWMNKTDVEMEFVKNLIKSTKNN